MKNIFIFIGIIITSLSCESGIFDFKKSNLDQFETIFTKTYPTHKNYTFIVGNDSLELFIGGDFVLKTDKDGNELWTQKINGDYVYITPSLDGGCYIAYYNTSNNYHDSTFISKISPIGNVVFNNYIGYKKCITSIILDDDGYSCILTDNWNTVSFVKFNSQGQIIKSFDVIKGYTWLTINTLKKLKNGNYIIVGSRYIPSENVDRDCILIEFSENGEIFIEKTYGGVKKEEFDDVIELADSGLVCIARTNSRNSDGDINTYVNGMDYVGSRDQGWIVKLNKDRNIEWQKMIGGSEGVWLKKIYNINECLYILYVTSSIDYDFSVKGEKSGYVKVSNNGNVEKIKYINEWLNYFTLLNDISIVGMNPQNDSYYENKISGRVYKIK